MSQSLIDKIGLLFRASLHDIVNQALQRDPIKVLNEHLRQHEEAQDDMQESLIVARANVKTSERHADELNRSVSEVTAQIEAVLTDQDPTNDHLAENLSLDLTGKQDQLEVANQTLAAARRSLQALILAATKLDGRIISLRNQIDLLKAIQMEADFKNISADTLITSARLISTGATSVNALAEKIKQNRDKADAKFEIALQDIGAVQIESDMHTRAQANLAAIRERLGVKESGTEVPSSLDMTETELAVLTSQH